MTIKKRLARSNIAMLVIPLLAAAVLVLLGTAALTNLYLTRSLFRHIARPLDTLTGGVARIRDGDLDTPIAYGEADVDVAVDVPDMTVLADRELLRRIAMNLLDNSRKYGGRADIRVRIAAEKTGGMAAVAFTDNGAGVPPEQLPRLFDGFYRGGAVRAENAAGGGLRVVVTLPLAKEDENG